MQGQEKRTLHDVLLEAMRTRARVRLIGAPMTILSEGFISGVGDNLIVIKHQEREEPDEFILESAVIKVQLLRDNRAL
ncbi:MAG: hypothetical protein QXS20_10260 [Candidatus Thorarchaeota archaeon]